MSRTSSALPTSYESANITNLPTSPEVDNTTTIEATSPNPSNNGSVPSSRYQGTRASTTLSYHSNTEDIRDPRGAVTDTDNLEVLNPIASQNDNASQEAIIVDSTPSVQLHPVPNNEAPPPYPGPPTPWRLQHDPRMLRNSSTVPLLLNGTSSNYNERRQEQVQSSRAVRTVNVQNIPTIVSTLPKQIDSVCMCLFICLSSMTLLFNNVTNHKLCVHHFHYVSFLFHQFIARGRTTTFTVYNTNELLSFFTCYMSTIVQHYITSFHCTCSYMLMESKCYI